MRASFGVISPIGTCDKTVMAELKRETACQGRTMSELVETALRLLFRSQRKRGKIPVLDVPQRRNPRGYC